MSFFYPKIDPESVRNIKIAAALAKEHPSYFLESDYPASVEELIKQVVGAKTTGKSDGLRGEYQDDVFSIQKAGEKDTKWDTLIRESEDLYNKLKRAGTGLTEGDEMSYFRTATSLLEKIVSLQERAMGLKQVHEFQQKVLEIMENSLSPTQRTQVMEELKNAIGE